MFVSLLTSQQYFSGIPIIFWLLVFQDTWLTGVEEALRNDIYIYNSSNNKILVKCKESKIEKLRKVGQQILIFKSSFLEKDSKPGFMGGGINQVSIKGNPFELFS